ncbi:MAG: hypothetical protein ACP5RJ_09005 [Conexivisphaera sp.]
MSSSGGIPKKARLHVNLVGMPDDSYQKVFLNDKWDWRWDPVRGAIVVTSKDGAVRFTFLGFVSAYIEEDYGA